MTGSRRKSGRDGLYAIAESLESIAGGMGESSSSSAIMTTPQRQTAAIEAVEANEGLSEDEFATAVEIFQDKSQTATAYLAIKNPKYRSSYLRR
jgi:hypothetical protein